jgi:hypothetical protein
MVSGLNIIKFIMVQSATAIARAGINGGNNAMLKVENLLHFKKPPLLVVVMLLWFYLQK